MNDERGRAPELTRRSGKTAAMLEAVKREGGGTIVCDPGEAFALAELVRAEGASVTCTLRIDFRRGSDR